MMIIKYSTVQDKNFNSDTFANIDTTTRTNSLKVFYDIVKHVEYDVYEDIQETIKRFNDGNIDPDTEVLVPLYEITKDDLKNAVLILRCEGDDEPITLQYDNGINITGFIEDYEVNEDGQLCFTLCAPTENGYRTEQRHFIAPTCMRIADRKEYKHCLHPLKKKQ